MRIGDICTRSVVHCSKDASALEAAKMVRDDHIGNIVIVDERDGRKVPVGVVTDRDIVVQLVAKEVDPEDIAVTDLMGREHGRAIPLSDVSKCSNSFIRSPRRHGQTHSAVLPSRVLWQS